MRNAKSGMRNKKQKLFAKLFNFKKKEYEKHSTREGYEKFVISMKIKGIWMLMVILCL